MSVVVSDGNLRLDLSSFQALVDGADESGALGVPGVPEALEAVRSPSAVAVVDVVSRTVHQRHQIWVGDDTAAMLLAVHSEQHQLMALPPTLLPAGVARVVRLGPRKARHPAPLTVDVEVAADLFAADDLLRSSAFETLPGEFAWHLGLSWPQGDRGLCVLDGPDGAWVVAGGESATVLEPTTATDLWRRLVPLLLGPAVVAGRG